MLIDVKDLIAKYSLSDLNQSADEYFKHVNEAAIVKKPFNDLGESPEVALTFLHVLKGIGQPKGALILDFGAGSCWSSKLMAGFGYNVIASDVSPRALAIGERDIARSGYQDLVKFSLFNGERIDLPDASVDAITCLSAFHHVPNPDNVIREFARVLKTGGVAGLSEPGPNHSKSAQAQDEMRDHTVIENDVDIDAIWATAQKAGFSNLELSLFYPEPYLLGPAKFKAFLNGERPNGYEENMRGLMQERRLFFMEKGTASQTSLEPAGLNSTLKLSAAKFTAKPGEAVPIRVEATNTGTALWRPSYWPSGPVRLGPSILSGWGNRAYTPRWMLSDNRRPGVLPGATVSFEQTITAPDKPGEYEIAFQLVSELVAWFGQEVKAKLVVSK